MPKSAIATVLIYPDGTTELTGLTPQNLDAVLKGLDHARAFVQGHVEDGGAQ